MMNPDDRRNINLLLILLLPTLFWLIAAKATENLTNLNLKIFWNLLKHTREKPFLLLAIVCGLILAILLIWLMNRLENSEFRGANFRKFLRGTKIVSGTKLKSILIEKDHEQVIVAWIPMPT